MRVRFASGDNARPWLFLDRYSSALYRRMVADELVGESKGEVLDLADRRILRQCEDGVLLRVGRDHLAVVAGQMCGGEVTRQHDAHGHVLDVVNRPLGTALGDADDMGLGLPVLVVAKA